MADQNPDFEKYMEGIRQAEADSAEREAMISAHEEWRSSTWGGWLVTKLLDFGNHFRPFFLAIADSMAEDKSVTFRLLSLFLRVLVILVVLAGLYVAAQIIQLMIGTEIVTEHEIVIVEEIPRSRAEKEGIVEGEEVLSPELARERLAQLEKEQQQEEKGEENLSGKRRNAKDKKNQ